MKKTSRPNSYAPLWILITLCAAPYLLGTLYYQFRSSLPEVQNSNYGNLIDPTLEIGNVHFKLLDETELEFNALREKWLMLYLLDSACTPDCENNLYFMRQIRKATAVNRFRINRLVVLTSPELITPELQRLLVQFPGMMVATMNEGSQQNLVSVLRQGTDKILGKILLVDPLGNFMMQYEVQPDPTRILKDIKRLLNVSRAG